MNFAKLALATLSAQADQAAEPQQPSVVIVHGAFADGSDRVSNKEAARVLGVSPSTVRPHLESVFRKIEYSTRAAATRKTLTWRVI